MYPPKEMHRRVFLRAKTLKLYSLYAIFLVDTLTTHRFEQKVKPQIHVRSSRKYDLYIKLNVERS